MPDPIKLIGSMIVAATVSIVVLLLASSLFGHQRQRIASAGSIWGTALAVILGCLSLGITLHFPPREDLGRFLLVLLPLAVVAETLAVRWTSVAFPLRGLLACVAAPILLQGSVYLVELAGPGSREWTVGQTVLHLSSLAVLLFVVGESTRRLARRPAGRAVPLALAGVILGTGLTIMLSGYATGGQVGFPMSASLVGIVLASCFLSGKLDVTFVTSIGVTGLFALIVVGHYFGELTLAHALALGLSPLCGWLVEVPVLRRVPLSGRGLARLLVTAVPVIVVLFLAQRNFSIASAGPTESASEGAGGLSDYMSFGK